VLRRAALALGAAAGEGAVLFDELIVWYLFLGGVGSGTFLMGSVALRALSRVQGVDRAVISRIARKMGAPVLVVGLLASAAGATCLLGDLPSLDNAHLLLFKPTFSAISVGALTLGCFMAALVVLAWAASRGVAETPRFARGARIVAGIALVLAVVVMVYTGVLLCLMPSVPLWNTPLLPVLFALSSCATGLGALMIIATVVFWDEPKFAFPLAFAVRMDTFVVTAEVVVVALMGAMLCFSSSEAASASLGELVSGTYAPMFWIGFVAVGMAAPPAFGLVFSVAPPKTLAPYAIIGACILIGGLSLRYCMIGAGVHLSAFMFSGL